jgi:hypothetical protein
MLNVSRGSGGLSANEIGCAPDISVVYIASAPLTQFDALMTSIGIAAAPTRVARQYYD